MVWLGYCVMSNYDDLHVISYYASPPYPPSRDRPFWVKATRNPRKPTAADPLLRLCGLWKCSYESEMRDKKG